MLKKKVPNKKVPLWFQFIYTGTIVTLISYITEKYKTSIGSILYSFPYTFLLTITILAMDGLSWKEYKKFSFGAILGLIGKIIFTIFFFFSYKKYGVLKAIFIGFIPWTLIALVIYHKLYEEFLNKYISSK